MAPAVASCSASAGVSGGDQGGCSKGHCGAGGRVEGRGVFESGGCEQMVAAA
jgi:hypothetical protein